VRWDRTVDIRVSTFDDLIGKYGEPAFCKIDVEGYEAEVVRGLSKPLRTLSFGYLPMAHDAALTLLKLVDLLADREHAAGQPSSAGCS
jgi:hypothetical protein